MAENKIELIKELAEWINENAEAVKETKSSIHILVVEDNGESCKVTNSFIGTGEAMMILHERVEQMMMENADDLLKYFLGKIMED